MPARPKVRRIVTKYDREPVEDEQWCKAYDQAGVRFEECDFISDNIYDARDIARERINKSYYPGMKMKNEE